jgi:hypothetical protein
MHRGGARPCVSDTRIPRAIIPRALPWARICRPVRAIQGLWPCWRWRKNIESYPIVCAVGATFAVVRNDTPNTVVQIRAGASPAPTDGITTYGIARRGVLHTSHIASRHTALPVGATLAVARNTGPNMGATQRTVATQRVGRMQYAPTDGTNTHYGVRKACALKRSSALAKGQRILAQGIALSIMPYSVWRPVGAIYPSPGHRLGYFGPGWSAIWLRPTSTHPLIHLHTHIYTYPPTL